MRNVDKRSFDDIINDILFNEKFNKLSNDEHHGITRYEHSIRVAKYSFLISKKFGLKNVLFTSKKTNGYNLCDDLNKFKSKMENIKQILIKTRDLARAI